MKLRAIRFLLRWEAKTTFRVAGPAESVGNRCQFPNWTTYEESLDLGCELSRRLQTELWGHRLLAEDYCQLSDLTGTTL